MITVVTASTPPRGAMLAEAVASVQAQTMAPAAHLVSIDHQAWGEASTRNAALVAVQTPWTAFLDDDDVMYPHHLATLIEAAQTSGADLVYPWFDVEGGSDPLGREGMPFDPDELRVRNYIPVTYLVRTELLRKVGGFPIVPDPGWPHDGCVDWGLLLHLLDAGAQFHHVAQRTWCWRHHGGNYSSRRWR